MTNKARPISERRFREGDGARFMKDAETVRCQSRAKDQLRRRFPKDQEYTKPAFNAWLRSLPENAFWPECQCHWAAEPNTFLCFKHGGRSKDAQKDPLDFLPGRMAEKIKMLQQNPVLLNRSFEIYQLLARNLELYERMGELGAAPVETRRLIWAGVTMIKNGDLVKGREHIEKALLESNQEADLYEEIRANMGLIRLMTQTHVQVAKDLQQIVTVEQHIASLVDISDIVVTVLGKYIQDEYVRDSAIADVQSRIAGRIGIRAGSLLPASYPEE